MHLGRTSSSYKALLLIALLFSGAVCYAQLKSSDDVIETTQDEEIQKEVNEIKPKTDEEFSREKISDDESTDIEDEIQQTEEETTKTEDVAPENELQEDEIVERKELAPENINKEDLEKTLEETAEKEKPKGLEQNAEETADGFIIDPNTKSEEKSAEQPEEITPLDEQVVDPDEMEENQEVAQPETTEDTEDGFYSESAPKDQYIVVPSFSKPLTDGEIERLEELTDVEIEKVPYLDQAVSAREKDYLKSYRERRDSWTTQFVLEYTLYEPIYYESGIETLGFPFYDEYYESSDVPLAQVAVDFKKNFGAGAVGLGLSGGYLSASTDEASLRLLVASVRAHIYLDTLFPEPYVVPYVTGGYTYIDYLEEYEDDLVEEEYNGGVGNFYVGGGIMLQLDWIDSRSDVSSYQSGIENTFIFAEGRMIMDSGIAKKSDDPDFSSDVFLSSGLRLEF